MDSLKAIGPALKALRKTAGLTQQQLADRAKVGFSMISGYERGTELPQLATLLRLLDAMGLDLYALAEAIDAQRGRVAPVRPGSPRAAWVALLMRNGVEARTLDGAAALDEEVGDLVDGFFDGLVEDGFAEEVAAVLAVAFLPLGEEELAGFVGDEDAAAHRTATSRRMVRL